jgi:hypothetical protein
MVVSVSGIFFQPYRVGIVPCAKNAIPTKIPTNCPAGRDYGRTIVIKSSLIGLFLLMFRTTANICERCLVPVEGTKGMSSAIQSRSTSLIEYPFRRSRLIYIGMSESKQNSIGSRLRGHLTGQSGNLGVMNYAAQHVVRFTYQSLDALHVLGTNLYELEFIFLADFLKHHGCYPICNGQSGISVASPSIDPDSVQVLWKSFD